ncbi:MAG: DUF4411 family protein [Clostridia bacterium]|nr:DUF4411 family protein [Clostridia bacterium]MDY5555555.1 DUF4411 family protein [Blautia sp.]
MVEEKFLLDANSFMTPYHLFYSFDLAPGFWKQLKPILLNKSVVVMDVVKDEVDRGNDELTEWMNSVAGLETLDRRDQTIIVQYGSILKYIQNSPLYNDKALRSWAAENVADPWLIAAAAAKGYTIITFEQSAGKISEKNPSGKPKIPDIAKEFGVKCEDIFYFMRKMNIKWI